jgi:hypothetical protein
MLLDEIVESDPIRFRLLPHFAFFSSRLILAPRSGIPFGSDCKLNHWRAQLVSSITCELYPVETTSAIQRSAVSPLACSFAVLHLPLSYLRLDTCVEIKECTHTRTLRATHLPPPPLICPPTPSARPFRRPRAAPEAHGALQRLHLLLHGRVEISQLGGLDAIYSVERAERASRVESKRGISSCHDQSRESRRRN